MTAQSTFPMNDLVLRLAGGQRDGELIPVSTQKCFLGMEESASGAEQPQCAIFRGPKGAAVRSYGDEVLVNGVATTVHWLKEGDRIEFPNSMTVEVTQLGWIERECKEHQSAEFKSEDPVKESVEESVDAINDDVPTFAEGTCEDVYYQSEPAESQAIETKGIEMEDVIIQAPESVEEAESHSAPEFDQEDARLDLIESQINEIQAQNNQTTQRFDQLDCQLSSLTEHLSQLITMAGETERQPSIVAEEESFATFGGPEEVTENSATEPQAVAEPQVEISEPENNIDSMGDYYSHQNDDDEKILTFDSTESEPAMESATHVEINDAPAQLNGVSQEEINTRQQELERVFGSFNAEPETQTETESVSESFDVADQSADEQSAKSFESPTHGLDEEVASFADNTMSAAQETENFEPQVEIESSSLDSQLFSDVSHEETEPIDSKVFEANELQSNKEQTIEEPANELVEEESAEATPASAPTASSVADLLERMKADGKWGGIPDVDDKTEFNPHESTPEPEPDHEPPVVVESEPSDDVDDYMSQLLNRMRGDKPATTAKPVVQNKPKQEPTQKKDSSFVRPTDPLKAEDFKPVRKAQKIESLKAMRALANSTARKAVHTSEAKSRKELGYVQLGIAASSLFMAVYYFFWQSTALLDTGFTVGMVCIGTAGFLGHRFYKTMKYNEMLEESDGDSNEAVGKTEEAEPVAEASQ